MNIKVFIFSSYLPLLMISFIGTPAFEVLNKMLYIIFLNALVKIILTLFKTNSLGIIFSYCLFFLQIED